MDIPSQKQYEQIYGDIEILMVTQPLAFVAQVVDEIRRYGRDNERWRIPEKTIEIISSPSRTINSLAEYIDRRRGYRIIVNQGLPLLLFDATQLFLSLTTLVNTGGEVLTEPEISRAEAREILQDALVAYVTAGEWRTHPLLYSAWTQRWQKETGGERAHRKDWVRYMQHMLGFVVCHELAHIILKHPKGRIPATERGRFLEEAAADRMGTEMMFRYLQSLTYEGYEDCGVQAARDHNVVSALKAVAVLFSVLGLIDHVRARYGQSTPNTHPSGGWRYYLLKFNCTQLCGIPEEAFSRSSLSDSATPDHVHSLFVQLALGI